MPDNNLTSIVAVEAVKHKMLKKRILSIDVSLGSYKFFIENIIIAAKNGESKYVCIANVHMLVEAHNNSSFAHVVNNADIVTPDGVPITWALKLLYGITQERVAGMDLLPDLLKQMEKLKLPVFFYGGTQVMLRATSTYINQHYPLLTIAGKYSPPFRTLTSNEELNTIDHINASGAAMVFVVLGCPKQEKWMALMKGKINSVMVGICGALPVMTGMQKRAPQWMQQYGLEWLFRFGQEPQRLFKRYAITNSTFLFLLIKEIIYNNKRKSKT